MGGGITGISAVELSTICTKDQECKINSNKDITNSTPFSIKSIDIQTQLTSFTNTSNLTSTDTNKNTLQISQNGGITTFTNEKNGLISGGILIMSDTSITTINNYGTMGGVQIEKGNTTINNMGLMTTITGTTSTHLSAGSNTKILVQNYKIKIDESATNFNKFTGGASASEASKNSHLMLSAIGGKIEFKDINSKIILVFGDNFSFGEAYFLSKLITDTDGNKDTNLNVDFSRLELGDKDLYTLVKSGDDAFIVNLIGGGGGSGGGSGSNSIILHTPITELYKSNIRTMNNFYTLSNSMIYPRKLYKTQNLGKKNQNNLVILREQSDRRISKNNIIDSSPKAQNDNIMLDSANILKSYESFSYRNESINRRIQRQNKRHYNRRLPNQSKSQNQTQNLKENQRDLQNLKADSANKTNKTNQNNLRDSANRDYYFILTPFVNHNLFFESGRYNLSGLEYGFLTAFSGKITPSNSLGAHFMMSYGSLGDSKDKDLSIKSLNLNVGLNYKLDLIWDMYLKARGDFYYFSNTLDSLTIKNIKPNNLGFGASVAYGKDFDFGKGGVLGIEAGIDYKALKTNEVLLNSQSYKQSLYNLIYADLGMSYNKYFGGFGINLGSGFKANLAPKLAESILILNSQNLRFTLDNDKYLAYANAGISYLLNHKDFDMEFSLAYYGNFGDRVISNGGGVEWRVFW